MNVRDFAIRSYDEAVAMLGDKTCRKVCNNTTLFKTSMVGCMGVEVRLHGHPIVVWYPGSLFLNAFPYYTVTTKDRMNRCIPRTFTVYSHKRQWVVLQVSSDGPPIKRVPFVEGMNLMTAFDGVE